MSESASNELLNKLCYAVMSSDGDFQKIKGKMTAILQNYEIEVKEKAIVVYSENKNTILLKNFLLSKTISGCTERTIKYYSQVLNCALPTIGRDADTISATDIQIYIANRMTAGVSNVSINNELRAMSSFFTWLVNNDYIVKNPLVKVEKLKCIKEKKSAFTDYEIEIIRDNCITNREKAIIEILLSTGCRVSELAKMKIAELEETKINVLGKGNKRRNVYINAKAKVAIENYLKERSDTNPYLFPKGLSVSVMPKGKRKEMQNWYKDPNNIAEGHMDASSIEKIVRKIGVRANVENVHPHRFRRTCATSALKKGMPIELVSKMLGHENIETTQIYLDINETDLERAHEKYV